MNVNKPTKTTKGRQKIEIKKMLNKGHRQVTFTKRRKGLFKKAAELCVLTGADVAVIVKSPGGRTYAFGHPDVGAVAERFFGGGESPEEPAVTEDLAKGFSGRYDDVAKELKKEKRWGEGGSRVRTDTGSGRFWWEEPIEGLGLDELASYVAALEELKKKLSMRADQMRLMSVSNSMYHSSPMLAMNPMNSEVSNELAYNHFINQSQASASVNSLVHSDYNFGYGM